jgi:hypothetical protein
LFDFISSNKGLEFMRVVRGLTVMLMMTLSLTLSAQQYLGSLGLIHVPTAEMDTVGLARVGAHYIPETLIPNDLAKDRNQQWSLTNYVAISHSGGYTCPMVISYGVAIRI